MTYRIRYSENGTTWFYNDVATIDEITNLQSMGWIVEFLNAPGQITSIESFNVVNYAIFGEEVDCTLLISNISGSRQYIGGSLEYSSDEGGPYAMEYTTPVLQDWIEADGRLYVAGRFVISGTNVRVTARTFYYSNGQTVEDVTQTKMIEVSGGDISIPSDYKYISRILHERSLIWDGEYSIAGVRLPYAGSWSEVAIGCIREFLTGTVISEGTPLETRIYKQDNSDMYIINFVVANDISTAGGFGALTRAFLTMVTKLKWVWVSAIFLGCIIAGRAYIPQSTTTKTAATIEVLKPKESALIGTGYGVAKDLGGGDTVVTFPNGSTITLAPNQESNIPAGATVIAGSQGTQMTYPGTETTVAKGITTDWLKDIGGVFKYLAIGGVAIAALVVIPKFIPQRKSKE
jgi:hypothetical protein